MIKKEITVADVFTYMGMNSKQLYEIIDKYYKDKPDDYRVRIADYKNDTSKFFTVLELKLAASDLHDRFYSPKIVDEESFNSFIATIDLKGFNNDSKRKCPDILPTFEAFKENEICLQYSPNHIFHDPKDNTLTQTRSLTRKYESYESIDWSEYRIIYDYYQYKDDVGYFVKGITKIDLENSKTINLYGLSRVL